VLPPRKAHLYGSGLPWTPQSDDLPPWCLGVVVMVCVCGGGGSSSNSSMEAAWYLQNSRCCELPCCMLTATTDSPRMPTVDAEPGCITLFHPSTKTRHLWHYISPLPHTGQCSAYHRCHIQGSAVHITAPAGPPTRGKPMVDTMASTATASRLRLSRGNLPEVMPSCSTGSTGSAGCAGSEGIHAMVHTRIKKPAKLAIVHTHN
jgi:hypothetical protein